MSATITWRYENGYREYVHELPVRKAVCERCEGHGTHLHPDIGGHAYSVEEFRESFDDEEAAEYFTRGGRYDVPCGTCHGANVVDVVDEGELNRTARGRRLLSIYRAVEARRAQWAAEAAAERRYLDRLEGRL